MTPPEPHVLEDDDQTTETVLERLAAVTQQAGMQPRQVVLGGGATLVARTAEFRWRWFATRLHTFVVASVFPDSATRHDLDTFLDKAVSYAIQQKGGLPRGLHTGVAVIAVAVTADGAQAAHEWASEPHGSRFAAFSCPVLVKASSGQIIYGTRKVLGRVYNSYVQQLIHDIVGRQ